MYHNKFGRIEEQTNLLGQRLPKFEKKERKMKQCSKQKRNSHAISI